MKMSLVKIVAVSVFLVPGMLAIPASVLAKSPAMATDDELSIVAPWLRDHLPDEALIYMRVPHLFGLLSAPKGSVLDPALRSRANVEAVASIRKGISDNILATIPDLGNPLLLGFERHMRSPVEVAVLLGAAPSALVAMNLDVGSRKDFEAMIGLFAGQGPALAAPLDEQGTGELIGLPSPAFLRYDGETGLLLVAVGPAVTAESFAALVATLVPNPDHAMLPAERRIDASGQGFIQWVNAERALPMLQLMLPPEQYTQMTTLGLDKVSAAAVGFGVANGKGRLALVADVPDETNRGLLPFVRNDLAVKSAGDPDGVLLVSIPTLEEFKRLEAKVLESSDEVKRAQWANLQAQMALNLGFTVDDLFTAVGPELLMIFDRAGDYSAMRIRDRKAWNRVVDGIVDATEGRLEKKRVGSMTIHHMVVPSLTSFASESGESGEAEQTPSWVNDLMTRQREHIYWVYEDDFAYFASMPQALIDRHALKARTDIGDWLQDTQRIDAREAVFAISGTTEKLPTRFYMAYLEVLQLLADVSDAEFDPFSMPTAAQLDLPRKGALGLSVSLGNPTLAVELSYENNPVEVMGGMGGVAAVGILAAIAIPAYQDYTIRAKVSEGLNLAAGPKAAVTEFYLGSGRFPDAADADFLSSPAGAGEYTESIVVEPDTGVITIRYYVEAVPAGGEIYLIPYADSGALNWTCSATIEAKHVPAACRDSGE